MRTSPRQRSRAARNLHALALTICGLLIATFVAIGISARDLSASGPGALHPAAHHLSHPERASVILLHASHGPRDSRGRQRDAVNEAAPRWYGGRD